MTARHWAAGTLAVLQAGALRLLARAEGASALWRRARPHTRPAQRQLGDPFETIDIHAETSLAAVRASLNRVPRAPVVLRVERGNRALASTLGMQLLRRHLERTALQVIVESRDGRVRRFAREQGFIAVRSIAGRELSDGRLRPRMVRIGPLRVRAQVLQLLAILALGGTGLGIGLTIAVRALL